jgi:hypothetical protein
MTAISKLQIRIPTYLLDTFKAWCAARHVSMQSQLIDYIQSAAVMTASRHAVPSSLSFKKSLPRTPSKESILTLFPDSPLSSLRSDIPPRGANGNGHSQLSMFANGKDHSNALNGGSAALRDEAGIGTNGRGPPPAAGSGPRGARLPADWLPSAADCGFAAGLGLDPAAVADEFRDYWHAKPGAGGVKLDWPATWRNWCRKAVSGDRRSPLASGRGDDRYESPAERRAREGRQATIDAVLAAEARDEARARGDVGKPL